MVQEVKKRRIHQVRRTGNPGSLNGGPLIPQRKSYRIKEGGIVIEKAQSLKNRKIQLETEEWTVTGTVYDLGQDLTDTTFVETAMFEFESKEFLGDGGEARIGGEEL